MSAPVTKCAIDPVRMFCGCFLKVCKKEEECWRLPKTEWFTDGKTDIQNNRQAEKQIDRQKTRRTDSMMRDICTQG